MRTIWKFSLHLGSQPLMAPKGAKILTAQIQRGTITLWALVDPEAKIAGRMDTVHVVGTGHQLNDMMDKLQYVATVQEGEFVWHVFRESFA